MILEFSLISYLFNFPQNEREHLALCKLNFFPFSLEKLIVKFLQNRYYIILDLKWASFDPKLQT